MKNNTPWTLSALIAAGLLALSACAQADLPNDPEIDENPVAEDARIQSEDDDLWVRAADSEMTSLFGTIENLTPEELEIVAAESPAAEVVELHEIVVDEDGQEVMQEIEGGFPIPAEGSLDMEPGGDHLMLIGLHDELLPGEVVEVTLEFTDGTTESIGAIVKDDGGQDEPYDHEDHGHHGDHGDDDDHQGHEDHGSHAHGDDSEEVHGEH
ncbi:MULTISPECIES: copper chaperone PCu(A)C [Actinomycetes]|uniref:Copper chaperone PCu(A)C n=2 Tax=Actinomycetes TaxID=1760 RepID=A0ABP6M9M6_9MICC